MTVALWTICRYSPAYELFGTEEEAAAAAVFIDLYDDGMRGVSMGVQYEDGRAVLREDWLAYRAEEERRRAEDAARVAAYASAPRTPPPPQRTIKDPFQGFEMDVNASEPGWLGLR